MANHALGAPQLPGPQPVAKPEVAGQTQSATDFFKPGGSEVADGIFRYAMMACGLCVLALVGVIVYELITKSGSPGTPSALNSSFKASGTRSTINTGPCRSSTARSFPQFWRLLIAVPLAIGVAVFITEMCPGMAARPFGIHHRIAGGDSQRDLRIVGHLRAGAAVA